MNIETKSIVKTKTFWLAVLQAITGVIVLFSNTYPSVGWLVIGKSLVDVILRLITEAPVSVFGGTVRRPASH